MNTNVNFIESLNSLLDRMDKSELDSIYKNAVDNFNYGPTIYEYLMNFQKSYVLKSNRLGNNIVVLNAFKGREDGQVCGINNIKVHSLIELLYRRRLGPKVKFKNKRKSKIQRNLTCTHYG